MSGAGSARRCAMGRKGLISFVYILGSPAGTFRAQGEVNHDRKASAESHE
jgi:hypothetical protein